MAAFGSSTVPVNLILVIIFHSVSHSFESMCVCFLRVQYDMNGGFALVLRLRDHFIIGCLITDVQDKYWDSLCSLSFTWFWCLLCPHIVYGNRLIHILFKKHICKCWVFTRPIHIFKISKSPVSDGRRHWTLDQIWNWAKTQNPDFAYRKLSSQSLLTFFFFFVFILFLWTFRFSVVMYGMDMLNSRLKIVFSFTWKLWLIWGC